MTSTGILFPIIIRTMITAIHNTILAPTLLFTASNQRTISTCQPEIFPTFPQKHRLHQLFFGAITRLIGPGPSIIMHYYIRFISDGGFRGRASRNDTYDERENSIDTRGAYTLRRFREKRGDGTGRCISARRCQWRPNASRQRVVN